MRRVSAESYVRTSNIVKASSSPGDDTAKPAALSSFSIHNVHRIPGSPASSRRCRRDPWLANERQAKSFFTGICVTMI